MGHLLRAWDQHNLSYQNKSPFLNRGLSMCFNWIWWNKIHYLTNSKQITKWEISEGQLVWWFSCNTVGMHKPSSCGLQTLLTDEMISGNSWKKGKTCDRYFGIYLQVTDANTSTVPLWTLRGNMWMCLWPSSLHMYIRK